MKKYRTILSLVALLIVTLAIYCLNKKVNKEDDCFVTFLADVKKQAVGIYWKDSNQQRFGSIGRLKDRLEQGNKKMLFAMNAGMYKQDNSPQGLYIENQKLLSPLDTSDGSGNFYMKPNGVFFITNNHQVGICESTKLSNVSNLQYATQSGPMLVIDGQLHKAFIKGSTNFNIRNGVGILPDSRLIFAMSKKEINFYDFAMFFKKLGCTNALYLDGFVSRMYAPTKGWAQTDGDFGVMIAVTENK